jgi:hypothetical protein
MHVLVGNLWETNVQKWPELAPHRFSCNAVTFQSGFRGTAGSIGILRGNAERFIRILGRIHSNSDGLASIVQSPEQSDGADYPKREGKHGPECRITSGVCGLPLGAKIILTLILAWPAWWLLGRAIDRLDGLGGRPRSLRTALLLGFGSAGLFGAGFVPWLLSVG